MSTLLQSIYYNDSVQFRVRKDLCQPIFLTRGVKQVHTNIEIWELNKQNIILFHFLGVQFKPCLVQPVPGRPVERIIGNMSFYPARNGQN